MRTNQLSNLKASVVDFIRNLKTPRIIVESFSCLNHQFSLFFLKNEIWQRGRKEFRNLSGGHYPSDLGLPMTFLPFGMRCTSTKVGNEPINDTVVSVCNGNASRKVNARSVNPSVMAQTKFASLFHSLITHGDRSFSIENTGQICKLSCGKFHKLEVYHNDDNKVHRERLNPETSFLEEAIV